jgi:hypothetical protein
MIIANFSVMEFLRSEREMGDEWRTLLTLNVFVFCTLCDNNDYPTVRCRGTYPFWDLQQYTYVRGGLVPCLGVITQQSLTTLECEHRHVNK